LLSSDSGGFPGIVRGRAAPGEFAHRAISTTLLLESSSDSAEEDNLSLKRSVVPLACTLAIGLRVAVDLDIVRAILTASTCLVHLDLYTSAPSS
jgi:hypothetical protein